jgi:hypothetical protein
VFDSATRYQLASLYESKLAIDPSGSAMASIEAGHRSRIAELRLPIDIAREGTSARRRSGFGPVAIR